MDFGVYSVSPRMESKRHGTDRLWHVVNNSDMVKDNEMETTNDDH